jgi:hypothetical protein
VCGPPLGPYRLRLGPGFAAAQHLLARGRGGGRPSSLERQTFFLLLIGLNELIWPSLPRSAHSCFGQHMYVLSRPSRLSRLSRPSRPSRPSSPGQREGRAVVKTHTRPAPPQKRL